MQARPSSAGTIIGRGVPVGFGLSFSAGSCGGPRSPTGPRLDHTWPLLSKPHAPDLGKEMGNVPFLNSDEVKRAGCAVPLIWFHVCFLPG